MFHTSRRASMRLLGHIVMLALSLSMIVMICFATVVYRTDVIYHERGIARMELR